MHTEIFRGEEDIDKSQIIITNHAIEQFYKRSIVNGLRIPITFEEIKAELRGWLNGSTHKNAVDPIGRVKSIIDHGETYFFRCQRWQFVVARNKSEPNKFSLTTVLYLNKNQYDLCFKK